MSASHRGPCKTLFPSSPSVQAPPADANSPTHTPHPYPHHPKTFEPKLLPRPARDAAHLPAGGDIVGMHQQWPADEASSRATRAICGRQGWAAHTQKEFAGQG